MRSDFETKVSVIERKHDNQPEVRSLHKKREQTFLTETKNVINHLQNERDELETENQILRKMYERIVSENNEREPKITMINEEKNRIEEDFKMF